LLSKQDYGDIEIEFDFMTTRGAVSGVYLQGRYALQLSDSWTKTEPTFADMGGLGQRTNASGSGFEGIAPSTNVAKAPGLWQHLKVRFIAPRFNSNGSKISNARFEEVHINGVLVQQQA